MNTINNTHAFYFKNAYNTQHTYNSSCEEAGLNVRTRGPMTNEDVYRLSKACKQGMENRGRVRITQPTAHVQPSTTHTAFLAA